MNQDTYLLLNDSDIQDTSLFDDYQNKFPSIGADYNYAINIENQNYLETSEQSLIFLLLYEGIQQDICRFLVLSSTPQKRTHAKILDSLVENLNGIMEHAFLPSLECFIICKICDKPLNRHSQRSESDIQHSIAIYNIACQQTGVSNSRYEQEQDEQLYQQSCILCQNFMQKSHFFFVNNQMVHDVCWFCLEEYISNQINNGYVEKIVCPHCTMQIDNQTIQMVSTPQIYEQYKKFRENSLIFNNPEFYFCPSNICSQLNQFDVQQQSQGICKFCQSEVCQQCRNLYHGKQSCEKFSEDLFKNYAKKGDLQKCPQCSIFVEQNNGCNHMTCAKCQYEFCWICSQKYEPLHFDTNNSQGCPGQMFSVSVAEYRKHQAKQPLFTVIVNVSFLVISKLIFLIFVIPVLLILGGPIEVFKASFSLIFKTDFLCLKPNKFTQSFQQFIKTMFKYGYIIGICCYLLFIIPTSLMVSPIIGLFCIFQQLVEW